VKAKCSAGKMAILKQFDIWAFPVLATIFLVLFAAENFFPLRKRTRPKRIRVAGNLIFSLPSLLTLRLIFIPFLVWIAVENQTWQTGIAYLISWPPWLEGLIVLILLDYFIYIWHWLTHRIPFLWSFHRVHHTDADLDLSTGLRFHFLELLISAVFRGASVMLTGASPLMVIIYEIVFEAATSFHHSNLHLGPKTDRILSFFVVTPRMHGIHHSTRDTETHSNFSTIFSFWDRMHGTINYYSGTQPETGLKEFSGDHSFKDLLLMPFRNYRKKND
jgi:sterol desaturase/sphingolipid hydroxylase (fatty acid hydroxylase superfamily)